jgi:hypothetical protein
MNDAQLQTIDPLRSLLQGTAVIQFQPGGSAEDRSMFIQGTLQRLQYARLGQADSGAARSGTPEGLRASAADPAGAPGLSQGRLARRHRPPLKGFTRKFTAPEVALLAETDPRPGTLSGPATKRLMQRAFEVFGDTR